MLDIGREDYWKDHTIDNLDYGKFCDFCGAPNFKENLPFKDIEIVSQYNKKTYFIVCKNCSVDMQQIDFKIEKEKAINRKISELERKKMDCKSNIYRQLEDTLKDRDNEIKYLKERLNKSVENEQEKSIKI